MLKLRLYGVAWYLCVAFFMNIACLFLGITLLWLETPVVLALFAIFIGLAFPRRPKGRWQRIREIAVYFIAVAHLLIIGLWLHYVIGYFGIDMARFRAMVKDADRIVIRDGGGLCHSDLDKEPSLYEITNRTEIAEFNAMFRFSGTCMPCMCCGYPGVDWWRDGKRIAVSAIHHGSALRVEGKVCDWRLAISSGRRIDRWLQDHCHISSKDSGGLPIYMECDIFREDFEKVAGDFMKANGGRQPSLEEVYAEYEKKGGKRHSCPTGGEYSLTFDEDGKARVMCSVHHND